MKTLIKSFLRDESGATAIEYGLIVSLIGVTLMIALQELGQSLSGLYENIGNTLSSITSKMMR